MKLIRAIQSTKRVSAVGHGLRAAVGSLGSLGVILTALLLCASSAQAQKTTGGQRKLAPAPAEICTLDPEHVDAHTSVRRAPTAGKKSAASASSFSVTYEDDCGEATWPSAAKQAFQQALNIWETHLTSNVPIKVKATWTSLSSNVLGVAGSKFLWKNFPGAPQSDTWYVDALADALRGQNNAPSATDADIIAKFSCDFGPSGSDDWYFGTDANPPAGTFDFVSVVLHELGHGLSFTGTSRVDEGSGRCRGTSGEGCWGQGSGPLPFAYDLFTDDEAGNSLINTAVYPNPSTTLGDQLQEAVSFDGTDANIGNGGTPPPLHAPSSWKQGTSYGHLDEDTYPEGNANSLMTPSFAQAEAIHSPGGVACGMFSDMGWTLGSDCSTALPVELVAFNAVADGKDVVLQWHTARETSNAGFRIERKRAREDAWEFVTFVEGKGTTAEAQRYRYRLSNLTPGPHRFRLKQVDYEGAFTYSQVVEATTEMAEQFVLSEATPNPFNPRAQFRLSVRETQEVRVDVVDALGRQVDVLFEGRLAGNTPRTFTFEAAGRPSGLYFYRVSGQRFTATKSMMLVK